MGGEFIRIVAIVYVSKAFLRGGGGKRTANRFLKVRCSWDERFIEKAFSIFLNVCKI